MQQHIQTFNQSNAPPPLPNPSFLPKQQLHKPLPAIKATQSVHLSLKATADIPSKTTQSIAPLNQQHEPNPQLFEIEPVLNLQKSQPFEKDEIVQDVPALQPIFLSHTLSGPFHANNSNKKSQQQPSDEDPIGHGLVSSVSFSGQPLSTYLTNAPNTSYNDASNKSFPPHSSSPSTQPAQVNELPSQHSSPHRISNSSSLSTTTPDTVNQSNLKSIPSSSTDLVPTYNFPNNNTIYIQPYQPLSPINIHDETEDDAPTDLPITPQNSTKLQRDLRVALTLTPTVPRNKNKPLHPDHPLKPKPTIVSPLKTTRYLNSQPCHSPNNNNDGNNIINSNAIYDTYYTTNDTNATLSTQITALPIPNDEQEDTSSQQTPRTPSLSISSANHHPFWNNNHFLDDDEDAESNDCFHEQLSIQDCRDDFELA